ncbi:MAG TPA: DUF4252 domain-containing protein [Alphaproteobacteria bacterium]|nr:DUF4252 domain-containing protein [Alphaproteobacteria bacterium]
MNRAAIKQTMRTLLRILVGVVLCCAPFHAQAQAGQSPNGRLQLTNLDKLSEKAASVTEITLDGSMLDMAAKFIVMDEDKEDAELVAIIKNLKGIYVKSFEFDAANQYSAADVEAVRRQLAAPGWSCIVNVTKRNGERNQVYLLKDGEKVAGVTILVAEARELTIVNIVGAIPVDKISQFEEHYVRGLRDERKPEKSRETGNEKK